MKYTAVIAICDGVPDSSGETIDIAGVELPQGDVIVSHEFSSRIIGFGKVTVEGNRIIAELDIIPERFPSEAAEGFSATVGGSVLERDGNTLKKTRITHISLTARSTDTRLPKIKRKE